MADTHGDEGLKEVRALVSKLIELAALLLFRAKIMLATLTSEQREP